MCAVHIRGRVRGGVFKPGLSVVQTFLRQTCYPSATGEIAHRDRRTQRQTDLVVEVGRGGSQHAAVGPEHLTLHLDGEVTQPALLPLPVQTVQHCRSYTGEHTCTTEPPGAPEALLQPCSTDADCMGPGVGGRAGDRERKGGVRTHNVKCKTRRKKVYFSFLN